MKGPSFKFVGTQIAFWAVVMIGYAREKGALSRWINALLAKKPARLGCGRHATGPRPLQPNFLRPWAALRCLMSSHISTQTEVRRPQCLSIPERISRRGRHD